MDNKTDITAEVKPMVSVLMPAYNQEKFVAEAIQSVLDQTFTDWELIIVDDGSPDNVAAVVAPYVESDRRIKFFHTENRGVAGARNFAASRASGQYLLPLDADDKIAPSYLSRAMAVFSMQPDTKLVYCKWKCFGASSHTRALAWTSYPDLLVDNSIFCSAVFRRSDLIAIGGYDEKIPYGLEDWEMWIRLLDEKSKVVQIDDTLFFYRRHRVSMSKIASLPDNTRITHEYIFNKHRTLYERFHPQSLDLLKRLSYLEGRLAKWKKRSIFARLWYAVIGKI